jgi:hypothetical protein
MAGQFDASKTTFMNRHTPGVNSTGMYIISGIPQVISVGSGVNAGLVPFKSFSREITIAVLPAAADTAKNVVATFSFDQTAGAANTFQLAVGQTITLPVRAKGIRINASAGAIVSVVATLTGITGDAFTSYKNTAGDGLLS